MKLTRKSLLTGFVVVVLLVILSIWLVDWGEIAGQLTQANRLYLGLGSGALLGGYVVTAWRWRNLLDNKPGSWSVFHAVNAGNLINAIIPVRPGEPLRIAILSAREKIPLAKVTSSFVVERWLEQLMRMLAFGGAVYLGAGKAVTGNTLLGLSAFVALLFVLIVLVLKYQGIIIKRFPPRLARLPRVSEEGARRAVKSLVEGFSGLSSPARLVSGLLWSLLAWGLFWAFHYLVLEALGEPVHDGLYLALSLGSLAFVPPSSTTLPGIYHVSMVIPLSLLSFDRQSLIAYAVLLNAVLMVWVVILGLIGGMRAGVSLRKFFTIG